MADFRGYVTAAGQTFEALAKQMGYPVTIGFIEVGDGKLPDSESPIDRTQLVHKLKQFPAIVEQDAKNPGQWVATCYIPADDAINGAGYFIREIGCKLINQGDGVLYAYRRVSDDWKPVITSGEAKSFIYKLRFIPSNGELLTPTIDPSVVLVDKEELARVMKAHVESRNHPDASETEKGFSRHATQDEINENDVSGSDAVVTAGKLWRWAEENGSKIPFSFSLWKRTISESGYDLVGRFGNSNTLEFANQALLNKEGTDAFVWSGVFPKNVSRDSNPSEQGWVSVGGKNLRESLSLVSGAGLVGGLPLFVTAEKFSGGASESSPFNDKAISEAISEAIKTGNYLYWPAVYEVKNNIDNFHRVRHLGPGGVKRGDSVYRVEPLAWHSNTLHVSGDAALNGDGISKEFPMQSMSSAFSALENAGVILRGQWNISVSAGTIRSDAKITGLQSENPINISGPEVDSAPLAEIDVSGQGKGHVIWIGNDMRFIMSHIMLKGARNGSGLASGLVMDAGTTGKLVNVWTRDCEQNGVNANIRCRVVIEGGDYDAGANSIRVYGNSTAYIGWNQKRVKARNASVGVRVSGSSYSHSDYIDFIDTPYGIVSDYQSHSTNYNNTFSGVRIGWETRSFGTINTNNPTFLTEPSIARSRALHGLVGSAAGIDGVEVDNRDTRNIQYYPNLGNGRYLFGYDNIGAPYKRFHFSANGSADACDWSIVGGVNFVFDGASNYAGANYIGIGAPAGSSCGFVLGDAVNPSAVIIRQQSGGAYLRLSGDDKYRFTNTSFGPYKDNDVTCGTGSYRVKEYYGISGAINTSDEREKTKPLEISEKMLDAADEIDISMFQWLSSIAEKGESARWHFGPFAQQIHAAFAKHGLDGFDYGLLCYDKWDDEYEDVFEELQGDFGTTRVLYTGTILIQPAGDRWGIRPDQCLWLALAAARRRDRQKDERISSIEKRLSAAGI